MANDSVDWAARAMASAEATVSAVQHWNAQVYSLTAPAKSIVTNAEHTCKRAARRSP